MWSPVPLIATPLDLSVSQRHRNAARERPRRSTGVRSRVDVTTCVAHTLVFGSVERREAALAESLSTSSVSEGPSARSAAFVAESVSASEPLAPT